MFFLYWPCKTVHADASDSWKRIYTKVVTNGRVIKGLLMELTSRHHHNGDSTGNKEIAEQLYKQRQTNGHKCKCPIGRWLQTVITFTERLLGAIPLHTVDQRPPSTSQHAAALLFTSALPLVRSSIGRTGLWPEIGNFYCPSKNNGFMMISTTFLSTFSIPIGSSYHYGTLFSL